jgi:multidrug efflux pump subunit AcrA (membrane-fusion protein)
VERKDNVLLVPNKALKRDKQGKYVEVLRNGAATRVYVTTGVSNEDYTEIVKGLQEGQEVIVAAPRTNILGGAAFGGG